MAKISGKAGRAMGVVPTAGQPTGLTRKQAQAELDVVKTYETTVLTGFGRRNGGREMQNMALQLQVRQQAGKFIPDVTVIERDTKRPLSVFGPLKAATYADALSPSIGDIMRRAIRAAEVAGR